MISAAGEGWKVFGSPCTEKTGRKYLSAFPHQDSFDKAAPDNGQDSKQVLDSYGLDSQRIDALIAAEVVGE